jgi:hypothetical protein
MSRRKPSKKTGNRLQDNAAELSGPTAHEFPSRIAPGEYSAICYKTETGISFGGRCNAFLGFRIYGGINDGIELFMTCTYPSGKISPRHKIYQQWMLGAGRAPAKKEKLKLGIFKNRMYRVLVRDTERRFSNGRLMPTHMQYSVIDTIIEVETG